MAEAVSSYVMARVRPHGTGLLALGFAGGPGPPLSLQVPLPIDLSFTCFSGEPWVTLHGLPHFPVRSEIFLSVMAGGFTSVDSADHADRGLE